MKTLYRWQIVRKPFHPVVGEKYLRKIVQICKKDREIYYNI